MVTNKQPSRKPKNTAPQALSSFLISFSFRRFRKRHPMGDILPPAHPFPVNKSVCVDFVFSDGLSKIIIPQKHLNPFLAVFRSIILNADPLLLAAVCVVKTICNPSILAVGDLLARLSVHRAYSIGVPCTHDFQNFLNLLFSTHNIALSIKATISS